MREKRNISRTNSSLSCLLHYRSLVISGEITNFSLTGILFKTDSVHSCSIDEDVLVVLECFYADDTSSRINCRVVRNQGSCIGLKFTAIDYDTLMKLKDILSEAVQENTINDEIVKYIKGK
jgi:hypothetical protein